jgi:E3 ubiquitin-protein ligase RNF14
MSETDECAELQRDELDALAAIYPDTSTAGFLGTQNTFSIDVEVELESSQGRDVVVHEPSLPFRRRQRPRNRDRDPGDDDRNARAGVSSSCRLRHLPPISLTFVFPPRYPLYESPSVSISTPWSLEPDSSWPERLANELKALWSYDTCGFIIIDHLSHYLDTVPDIHIYPVKFSPIKGGASFSERLRLHDRRRARALFDRQSFSCGICLDDRKGKACVELSRCRHVYA